MGGVPDFRKPSPVWSPGHEFKSPWGLKGFGLGFRGLGVGGFVFRA